MKVSIEMYHAHLIKYLCFVILAMPISDIVIHVNIFRQAGAIFKKEL